MSGKADSTTKHQNQKHKESQDLEITAVNIGNCTFFV